MRPHGYSSFTGVINTDTELSSIAAVVLPARRREALVGLTHSVTTMMLAAWPGRTILQDEVHGNTSSVSFLRVGGDPFRSDASATVASGRVQVVQAGYYLDGSSGSSSTDGDRVSVAGTIAELGVQGLTTGDGVFAFAAWDHREERFVASVDKLGMRPFFWCEIPGGGVAVASEIKTLLPLLGGLRVNWSAWEDQVRLGFQIGDHTLVRGINRFRRAGCLTWDGERISHTVVESFLESAVETPFRREEFVESNHSAFMHTMRELVGAAGSDPLLLTVSAGLDSRRILSGLLELGREPELLTAAMPQLAGVADEMAVVHLLAATSGCAVTEFRPASTGALARVVRARDAYTDFEANEHSVYALFAQAGVRNGINFDGMAGDTLLNPGRFVAAEYLGEGGEARFLRSLELSGGGDWVRFPPDGDPFSERVRAQWMPFRNSPSAITLMVLDSRARRGLALGPVSVQAHAFESTFPFLSRQFMLSGLSLPPAERLRGLLQRQLTRRINESLADLPSSRDSDYPSSHRSDPFWDALRPRRTLARALWRRGSSASAPLPQLGRFLGATVLGKRIGVARYEWQWRKADWFRRIREQEELVAAGWESYLGFVEDAVAPVEGTVAVDSVGR